MTRTQSFHRLPPPWGDDIARLAGRVKKDGRVKNSSAWHWPQLEQLADAQREQVLLARDEPVDERVRREPLVLLRGEREARPRRQRRRERATVARALGACGDTERPGRAHGVEDAQLAAHGDELRPSRRPMLL